MRAVLQGRFFAVFVSVVRINKICRERFFEFGGAKTKITVDSYATEVQLTMLRERKPYVARNHQLLAVNYWHVFLPIRITSFHRCHRESWLIVGLVYSFCSHLLSSVLKLSDSRQWRRSGNRLQAFVLHNVEQLE